MKSKKKEFFKLCSR